MILYILSLACGIGILAIDQLTKYYISSNFELGYTADFIKGIINIHYIHNRGAAWGMLSGYTWVLLAITLIVMVGCVVLLLKNSIKSKLMLWAMTLVLSGGIGNLIDRVFRDGNVVDFLHFEFWPEFPVFNVADCSIVVGAGLLILYFVLDSIREYKQKKPQGSQEESDG